MPDLGTFLRWNLVLACILSFHIVLSENASANDHKYCTNHADCDENECCTFELKPTLTSTTNIIWKCKPLGALKQPCHSLGNVHCPCQSGLRCEAKAVWFFGSGVCGEIRT